MKTIVSAILALSMLSTPVAAVAHEGRHHRERSHHHEHGRGHHRDDWRGDRHEGRKHAREVRKRCEQDSNTGGTVLGAIGCGVLGNIIAGKGDKTLGTVIGAGVGGVVGNRIDNADKC